MPHITENYLELIPAYGRDYGNKRTALEAFHSGKDWRFASLLPPYAGQLTSVRDFARGTKVFLRFNGNKSLVSVKV